MNDKTLHEKHGTKTQPYFDLEIQYIEVQTQCPIQHRVHIQIKWLNVSVFLSWKVIILNN